MAADASQWDIRSIPKVEVFSGHDIDWGDWSFVARSYFFVLGVAELLEHASHTEPPKKEDMTPDHVNKAELVYHILVQTLRGKASRFAPSDVQ